MHIPMPKQVEVIPAASRGHRNFGWLQAHYSFSFGEYFDPQRLHFGALHVLNDDTIAPGTGFGMHPHRNMEIITIPLEGHLLHRDSMGHQAVISAGQVQVMSAGTGIFHSEYNASNEHPLKLLQIWIVPQHLQVAPRYDMTSLPHLKDQWITIVGPQHNGGLLWIHQQAWLSLATLNAGTSLTYSLHQPDYGMYLFLIDGKTDVLQFSLNPRDALKCKQTTELSVLAKEPSRLLLIEVPLME
ncbi:MAG: pirin family protein [Chitinophagales bacterium]|nr:pirin family protein [Chitinophagales bacterium]MDW8427846.1 pirin family protein [Chitinophagales bacterium]